MPNIMNIVEHVCAGVAIFVFVFELIFVFVYFQVYWIDILVLFGFFVFLRVMGYFVLKLKLKMDR